jgi:hypothetical protein
MNARASPQAPWVPHQIAVQCPRKESAGESDPAGEILDRVGTRYDSTPTLPKLPPQALSRRLAITEARR